MPSVITSSDFNVSNVVFGKHKPNINGGFDIEIKLSNSNEEVLIQTPKMRAPFGISTDKVNPNKKFLNISFQNIETNNSIKKLRDGIDGINNAVIDYVQKNSKALFKSDLSREVIKAYFTSSIKESSKPDQYADTFRFKLLFIKPNPDKNLPDGKFLTTFWNNKGEEQKAAYLDKGDHVTTLLKPQSIWIGNKQFGITWVCTQIRVQKQVKANGYAFKKTEDDDPDDIETATQAAAEDNEELLVTDSEEEVEVEVDA
jgi:hypothetical protein